MAYSIPKTPFTLMTAVYRRIFPAVNSELTFWEKRAGDIPDEELRKQALASIESKRFHCLGGAVYALLAGYRWREAIRFIVAYQTISDYLDNLCDRSTSLDPDDFRQLHEAMADALSKGNPIQHYYALRTEQRDGEYLADLVRTCQKTMRRLDTYDIIRGHLLELEQLYSDLQVHKHVELDERVPRLVSWFREKTNDLPLYWYEYAAAAGSTLGIFCLVSYALGGKMTAALADDITESYFPFMQGLHILLDYYIDQEEDRHEGDLNFCHYYDNQERMKKRLIYFIEQAHIHVQNLPDRHFHEMVHHGLVGLYLGDPKVKKLEDGLEVTGDLLRISGYKARFFHWNTKLYHRMTKTRT
ncbi:tetraprenyl-beta-curcumene synthase family protein [Lentibacillus sp.]|uniref:tetraprenyl-beta-curcumene synthase family protein n=1 Tax=Lentibacillus sp. TaxID=1925746 RepID=UPI002B4B8137|nr:tetraprenyl-beta-curcumene synthase family protein [Lentibacillus sp.]HLS10461.1 tetraprenyl-beta-curcumene synthase family protein [Lentibacillus sp.]